MKICGPVLGIFGQALSILKSTSAKVLREVAKINPEFGPHLQRCEKFASKKI